MSQANPRWGAPRIHGELLKLGFELSEATVAKYMVHHRKPPSQTWRTFLANHMKDMVSSDFFVVPTVFFRANRRSVEELSAIEMRRGDESIPPGLGILIAEKFVDEFIVSEKGSEIFLIKYLPKVENEKL